ncbi:diguanylate cyclase (GGDEF)-like protein [Arthrobacter sp. V4I6]|uniref:GGDEF domain-containing protein n=1 Tax=unclassified Arthrobacter TaxID=235627 RepID=UPI0027814922|nr:MULTISPECIES: GGDEF domain-containing protein [unclassified Arthrobacter]MDQ0823086.1 diguanylate cyclase (GGDEF)-like protein [Arthrobacter sp. V1I7]MDQ0852718.1 diguanylate cyclase (GGDEF)-like protein [Arthrobacter sp. V4I6]
MVLLDRSTLMVVFAVMTLTMLVLFYFDTYRKNRAPFAGWWCIAVGSFFCAALFYFLGEVSGVAWATSVGNGVMVLGSGCVWAGARSLAGRRVRSWLLALPSVAAWAVAVAARISGDNRTGSIVLLAMMGAAIGLASAELRRQRAMPWHLVRSLAVATAVCAAYYLSRMAGLAVLGPEDPLFQLLFGTGVTLLMAMVLLVVVSSSITALNNARRTEDLKELASLDDLTGLLNRREFLQQAQQQLRTNLDAGIDSAVVMADLDGFKAINDSFGHDAGDGVIRAFSDACRAAMRTADLVGRYGGEEFAMLLTGVDAQEAVRIADRINRLLAEHSFLPDGAPQPTASFGIVDTRIRSAGLQRLIREADGALYEAKAAGRNRAVVGLALAGSN